MTKTINVSGIPMMSVFVALVWLSAPATAQTSNAAANWDAMAKCAAISDDDARHECSDEVFRKAGLLKSVESTSSKSVETKPMKSAATTPTESAETTRSEPRKAADVQPATPRSFPPRKLAPVKEPDDYDEIEVRLEQVDKAGDGKLVLTTTEGEIWRQLYSNSLLPTPRAGQLLKVKQNSLGGFMCRVEKSPSFRCKPSS